MNLNMRRTRKLGWVLATLATAVLATPALAIELRGRSGSRVTHRLAALELEDGDLDPEQSEPDSEPEEAPELKPAPAPKPQKATSPPRGISPMFDPSWDGGNPMPSQFMGGGPCSDGFCGECPVPGGGCGLCGNGSWGSVEYLLWWRDKRRTPPLVTTTTGIVNQNVDGELNQANTRILLGPSQYSDHLQPGGRLDLGYWLDPCQTWGVGMRFAILGDDNFNYLAGSAVNPVLTVPFFNLDPRVNAQDTLVVAHPLDNSTGSIQVLGHNEVNMGDVYLRLVGARTERYRVDLVGGYVFSNIMDDMTLRTQTTQGQTNVEVRDRFHVKNNYNGGSIGLMGQFERGQWTVNTLAKVGLTNVFQSVEVDGLTNVNGVPQTLTGLFAQTSNSGTISRNRFAAIPEFNCNWNYRMGRANLLVGYSLIYWSSAARAGDQMNPQIDPTQTAARPPQQIVSDNYFVHGLNFGVSWMY
jgi:hypothetical protein